MLCKWCGMESATTDKCSWCYRPFGAQNRSTDGAAPAQRQGAVQQPTAPAHYDPNARSAGDGLDADE
ncbi:MAG TPA: hypothetical protein VKT77_00680, partial [Chthonomonadaceae bacterium]|nr:hypothetical protein [Chthonomonadaceae bacterium]